MKRALAKLYIALFLGGFVYALHHYGGLEVVGIATLVIGGAAGLGYALTILDRTK